MVDKRLLYVGAGAAITLAVVIVVNQPQMVALNAPAEAHTVSWFKAHKDAMVATLTRCNDNPSLQLSEPDCINVVAAKQSADAEEVLLQTGGTLAELKKREDKRNGR